MDQITLVDKQIIDGETLIKKLRNKKVPVQAACWMKTAEDEQWYLYIVSPIVDDDGLKEAYRRVQSVIRSMAGILWIGPFEVRLISPLEPLAQDLETIRSRYSAKLPTRYNGAHLGGMNIEGAYIYPL